MSCRSAASTRAWQTLPRHLRRRAASHDVRRVPVRLREKARLEVRSHYFTLPPPSLTLSVDGPREEEGPQARNV